MGENTVSIITPAYNSEKTIGEAIQSVLNQTYQNWEMIIINDCSRDQTLQIVITYSLKDNRITVIDLERNNGVANARNIGIKKAKGRYIAFLDSDDLWSPQKLSKQVDFMKEKKCYFSYTAYEIISADGSKLDKTVSVPPEQEYEILLKQNTIGCLTVMV